eukprot:scaffold22229_cov78-Cyclotella_meneghiniana.AAC.6
MAVAAVINHGYQIPSYAFVRCSIITSEHSPSTSSDYVHVICFFLDSITSMTPALILIAPLPLNKVEVLEKGANQLDDVGWVWLVEGPRSVIINDF